MKIKVDVQKSKDNSDVKNGDILKNEIEQGKDIKQALAGSADLGKGGDGERKNEIKVRACLLRRGMQDHREMFKKNWRSVGYALLLLIALSALYYTTTMQQQVAQEIISESNDKDLDEYLKEDLEIRNKIFFLCNGTSILKFLAIAALVASIMMSTFIDIFLNKGFDATEKIRQLVTKTETREEKAASFAMRYILLTSVIELTTILIAVILYISYKDLSDIEFIPSVNLPIKLKVLLCFIIPDLTAFGLLAYMIFWKSG